MNEKNLTCELKAVENGLEIYRCEAKKYDVFTGETKGHTKVYYDVCIPDGDIIDSFKTLREAKAFAKNW